MEVILWSLKNTGYVSHVAIFMKVVNPRRNVRYARHPNVLFTHVMKYHLHLLLRQLKKVRSRRNQNKEQDTGFAWRVAISIKVTPLPNGAQYARLQK
jgi:hypothetical protein